MSDEIVDLKHTAASKQTTAMPIVKRNMLWSVGAGLLPIPLVELVAITAVEVKLIKELADHYTVAFRKDIAETIVASLVGSLGSVTLGKMIATSSLRFVPVFGPIVAATSLSAIAAAITYATGKVFIMHFESGGTLLDFDPAKMREYFREEFAKGAEEAKKIVAEAAGAEKPAASTANAAAHAAANAAEKPVAA